MQHHQPHHHYNSRGGHQEGHLNGHSTAGHGHNGNGAGGSGHSRRSGGHNGVHNHMLNDHTNGMLNGHMLSQMHATSAGQKERPPLLRQLDTSNPQHDKITNQFKEVVWMLTQRPEVFDNIVPYVVGALNCEKIKLETSEKLAHILVAWVSLSIKSTDLRLNNKMFGSDSFNTLTVLECGGAELQVHWC